MLCPGPQDECHKIFSEKNDRVHSNFLPRLEYRMLGKNEKASMIGSGGYCDRDKTDRRHIKGLGLEVLPPMVGRTLCGLQRKKIVFRGHAGSCRLPEWQAFRAAHL